MDELDAVIEALNSLDSARKALRCVPGKREAEAVENAEQYLASMLEAAIEARVQAAVDSLLTRLEYAGIHLPGE